MYPKGQDSKYNSWLLATLTTNRFNLLTSIICYITVRGKLVIMMMHWTH